ncbi:MAG: hypothetical protein ACXWKG_08070, partial [Limisphaerales bacterium]
GHSIGLLAFDVITGAGGFVLFKRGKYRDKLALVVPDYAVLKAADTKVKGEDWQVRQKEIETELREQHKGDKAGRNRALSFATEAYSALGRCDYLRAHVAARLAVADNQRSVEGVLASAIASAALNQHQHAAWGIARARQLAGMDAFSICWGIGWANLLFGNNEAAEVMLDQAIKKKPGSPTLHMLMSVAQARRGKMQAAIASARRACTPSAPNMEYTKTFAAFLLDAGYLREAEQQLALVQAVALKDPDVVMLNLRAALLTNNWSQADGWAETLRNSEPKTQQLIRAGELHETARRDEQAQQFYLEASGRGHYPQALLGLSRVAALKKKKEESVAHALGALNLDLPLPEDAVGPLPLFPQIMAQVMLANERVPNCEAWIATLAGSVWHAHLNGRSFMVYAVSRSMAEDYVNEMLRAFRVQSPPTQNAGIAFRMAPKEQQPLAPVYPGVQFVVG